MTNPIPSPAWDERFAGFKAAWVWAKTDRWLDEVSDEGATETNPASAGEFGFAGTRCLEELVRLRHGSIA